ncbi:MAG TPA: hypothetical protein VHT53_05175 [Candidatus Elarobacter sp.]|jgi:hypothetical protein|nr:hypothetical protein [Candidatus Elarobacter sp.]
MLHALVLLAAIPTYGPIPAASGSPSPVPAYLRVPTTAGEALIVDSGSTNRAGYRLRVYADGTTALQQGDVPIRKHVSETLVKRFFADLEAAGPLDRLPAGTCMKSASFGSVTRVGYRGALSPDVTCPSSSTAERALAVDVTALASAAGVSMLPRGGGATSPRT